MTWEAITIDNTVGGTSTNSYLTLAECNEYLHSRPFHSAWDDITDDDEKKASIVWATQKLNEYRWSGYIADVSQLLPFPRSGLYDYDSREYSSTAYPEWLKLACSELAFFMATTDRMADSGTEGFSEIKVASIAVKIDKSDRANDVPDVVFDMVKKWVKQGAMYNAGVIRV